MYRYFAIAPIFIPTTIINWLVVFSISMRIFEQHWPKYLICPILTLFSFYYYAFHEFERTTAAIYYLMMIQLTTHFLFVVAFNESWVLSLVTFAATITVFLYKLGVQSMSQTIGELAVQVVYLSIVYAVIAYTSEKHRKEAFIGREQGERSFTKWLKIFETFPEGIAYMRGN